MAGGGGFREESQFGEGPCVEHGDTLYVFDQAVLTAYELNTGNARWRLPSVGVVGLFFDDQDNVYVNTTTGNPDDIKYSRQIDVTRKTRSRAVQAGSARPAKPCGRIKPGGYISYLSGKFIYTIQSYDPNPTDEEVLNDMTASLQKPPYLRIRAHRPTERPHYVGIPRSHWTARPLMRASMTTPSNSSLKAKCRCCAT